MYEAINAAIYNFPFVPLCAVVVLLYIVGCFFFDKKREYFLLTALLAALLSSPWLIRVATATDVVVIDGVRYVAYCVTVAIAAMFLFALCNISKYSRPVKYLILTLLLLPAAVYWCYFAIQHALLNVDAIIAIWQTNLREALEYLVEYLTFALPLTVILIAVVLFAVLHFLTQGGLRTVKNSVTTVALIMLFLFVNMLACRAASSNSMTLVFANAGQDITQYLAFKKTQQQRKDAIKSSAALRNIKADSRKGIYIVIIGESHNRDYTHAYGYPRKNSPWLDKMLQTENCVLFENAYACHTQTVPALSYALTAKNQYNGMKLQEAVSIIEAAEAAGFETVWLSNQIKYSMWDTPVSVIGSGAAQQKWLNNSSGNSLFTASYDGALLKALGEVKIKEKMLIIIHLMGSHIDYQMRYPKQFDKFGQTTDEETYCNSLLYNDYVVQGIYEKAKTLPHFKTLLYLSDHASVPKDKLDHDSARFTPSMTHIPMYLCWSGEYAKENSAKLTQLKLHKGSCFTNDLLFNLQLSLMGIKLPIYEAQNDLASCAYNCDRQRFRTSHGEREVR